MGTLKEVFITVTISVFTNVNYHLHGKKETKKLNLPSHGAPEQRVAEVNSNWAVGCKGREDISNIWVTICFVDWGSHCGCSWGKQVLQQFEQQVSQQHIDKQQRVLLDQ